MPVVFISRGTVSGVHRLVDCLHERAKIRCISHENLVKIVNQHGELATRIVDRLATAASTYDQFSELRWPYIVLMRQALLEEIRHDNIVFHGYSSHLLLPRLPHFIRIRIEAPLRMRIEMTMQRLGLNESEAREYIDQKDDYRIKWARFMFAQEIRNTMLYDLNLNLGHITMKAACGIIEHLFKEPDFQSSFESRVEVNRLYLATNIESALVTDPRTASIEVSADVNKDNHIRLIGPYLENAELETIISIAKSVSGMDSIEYTPGYRSPIKISGKL